MFSYCRHHIVGTDRFIQRGKKTCDAQKKQSQWASYSMLWVTRKPVVSVNRGLSIAGGKIRGYYGVTFARTLAGKGETSAAGTDTGEQRRPEGNIWLVWWWPFQMHTGWDIIGISFFQNLKVSSFAGAVEWQWVRHADNFMWVCII